MLGYGIGDALLGGTHLIRRRLLLEHGLTVCGRGFRHVTLIGFQHVRAEIVRRLLETVFERASEQSTAFAAVHARIEGLRRGLATRADLLVDRAAETPHRGENADVRGTEFAAERHAAPPLFSFVQKISPRRASGTPGSCPWSVRAAAHARPSPCPPAIVSQENRKV